MKTSAPSCASCRHFGIGGPNPGTRCWRRPYDRGSTEARHERSWLGQFLGWCGPRGRFFSARLRSIRLQGGLGDGQTFDGVLDETMDFLYAPGTWQRYAPSGARDGAGREIWIPTEKKA